MSAISPSSSPSASQLIQRRSIAAIVAIVVLLAFSSYFLNLGQSQHQRMLQSTGLTYDQRLLLDELGDNLSFLIRSSDSSTSDRLIKNVQANLAATMAQLNTNQTRLHQLHDEENRSLAWFSRFFPSVVTRHQLQEIDQSFSQLRQRIDQITQSDASIIKTGANFWAPRDLEIGGKGRYTLQVKALNERIHRSSIIGSEKITRESRYFLAAVVAYLALVWGFIFRPLFHALKSLFNQIESNQQELLHQSRHDTLTSLYNRKELNQLIEQTDRAFSDTPAAALAIDLDNFKIINDSFGHEAGDEALKALARRLGDKRLPIESQFRIGGDEFIVIFQNFDRPDTVLQRANAIFQDTQSQVFSRGSSFSVYASVGVSFKMSASESLAQTISAADIAMYHAKRAGGRKIQLFSDITGQKIQTLLTREQALKAAVKNREITPYYQPIVNATNNEVISFEALARWNHPDKGMLPPKEWIDIANRIGILTDISLNVFDRVTEDILKLKQQGWAPLPVSINVTLELLLSGELHDRLQSLSTSHGKWLVQCLNFEVPESVVLDRNYQEISDQVKRLRGLGTRISLDDFGTGYASLSHLSNFPLDTIKIDKLFIQNLVHSNKHKVITQTVIDLAKGLKVGLICEGVEDAETLQLLVEMGAEHIQGWYFYKPISYAQVVSNFFEHQAKQSGQQP